MFNDIDFLGMGSAFSKDFKPTAFVYKDIYNNHCSHTANFFEANQSTLDYLKTYPDFSNIIGYNFYISHFHEDHIGCLGNCLAWLVFMLKVDLSQIKIFTLDTKTCQAYIKITMPDFANKIQIVQQGFEVEHAHGMKCCGFKCEDFNLIYTGDCINIPQNVIDDFNSGSIRLITECSVDENTTVHQYLFSLLEKIDVTNLDYLLLIHHDSLKTFIQSLDIILEICKQLQIPNYTFRQFVKNELYLFPQNNANKQIIIDKFYKKFIY